MVYTAAQSRELDGAAIAAGVAGIVLMKRAGRAVFDEARRRWPAARGITVFCGAGNNAGDGYVVAGLAEEAGLSVQLFQVGAAAKFKGDAATARDWALSVGVCSQPFSADAAIAGDVVVDALLGTGAAGPARPAYAAAIQAINASAGPVIAVDLPSGIAADTGERLGAAVTADVTVTFIGEKLGLHTGAGVDCAGELVFASLGVPEHIYAAVPGLAVLSPPPPITRPRSAHKHTSGHVLVIGGDHGMGGAALLASEAALRAGAGLVSVATRPEHCSAFLARRPELMVRGVAEGDAIGDALAASTVVAVGPGLGRGRWGAGLLAQALAAGKTLVIDADGLNLIAGGGLAVPPDSVMTPHPGEAARLLGIAKVLDRPAAARDISQRYGNVVALKGAGTLVAQAGALRGLCAFGNPGLATAGAGDVLTGVVAGLVAQRRDIAAAAAEGVCLHALAGDAAAARLEPQPLVAADIIDHLWRRG